MKQFSLYTSRAGNVLPKQLQLVWRTAMLVLAAFLFVTNAIAQSHPVCTKPNGDPDPPHCVSKDLEVLEAFLTSDQCACISGDEITADLNFRLSNKTGSERTSFAVFAILVKENPDGTKESVYFSDCVSPVPAGETSVITFEDGVTYECGQSLTLTDVYLAWTDASDGDRRQCGGEDGLLNNFCDIDPKCGKPADIVIRPLLTASVTDTDGTCEGESDGSITVEASGGTGPYDFVLNPGNVTVNNDADGVHTFTGLAAGNYSIKVTDAENCEITVNGTVEEFANPDPPTVAIDQPDCEDPTATITVTSSTTGLLFSFDGGAFAAYPAGGWVVDAGTSHTLVAQNSNGCESDPVNIDIDDAPIVPSGITTNIVQPTCTVPTGSIEFLTPLGDFMYSIDGGQNYQSDPFFGDLDPGTYPLSVKSGDECVVAAGEAVIDDAPIVPSGITTNVVQPTCEALGSIEFLTPLGDFTYSIDGGANYQANPFFGNLSPGTYALSVQSGDQCVTAAGEVILNEPVCDVFEGCTLGYWKNHTGSWACYSPDTRYNSVFTSASTGTMTLLQALNSKGGGVNNLYRQSVAALLNACHPEINFELTTQEVIDMVNAALTSGTAGSVATELDEMNNAGCPIDAHNRPISVSSSSSIQGIEKVDELRAYPTPFSDKATIEFTTSVDENYSVRLYDMKGALIKELKAGHAKAGVVTQVEVDGRNLPEGLYLARMVSDSGARAVKLLLKR